MGSDLFFFKSILIFKVEFKFVHIKEEVPRRVSTVVESSVIMLSRGMLSSASKIEKKVFFLFKFEQLHHETIDSVP